MLLTAENVYATFFDSLALDTEVGSEAMKVRGVVNEYTFSRERLQGHVDTVRGFLGRLSAQFYVDRGGGHSFQAMGTRRDGVSWGDTYDSERLLVLGRGLGLANFCLERRRWDVFPKGIPYVRLNGDLFRFWATFRRVDATDDPIDQLEMSFLAEDHPAPPSVREDLWFKPGTFLISDLSSNSRRHVAEAFYMDVVVDGFFDDVLPSWILDPETTLQLY